jgi:hypothetical protein
VDLEKVAKIRFGWSCPKTLKQVTRGAGTREVRHVGGEALNAYQAKPNPAIYSGGSSTAGDRLL